MTLHDAQEFYDHLGGWADEHLTLATTLSVDDVVLRQGDELIAASARTRRTYEAVILHYIG